MTITYPKLLSVKSSPPEADKPAKQKADKLVKKHCVLYNPWSGTRKK